MDKVFMILAVISQIQDLFRKSMEADHAKTDH
jgi:hypothetical protein